MGKSNYPFELLTDPASLADCQGWDEAVYRDFIALQEGSMEQEAFWKKYETMAAILILDMTSFTESSIFDGDLHSLLRIFDVQKVCAPIFLKHKPQRVRTFADDFTVIFDDPHQALEAAFEVHTRIEAFNQSDLGQEGGAECKIGLGYGRVLKLGVDQAMGSEMNQTSKLGEDTAKARETLITEGFFQQIKHRSDCQFEVRTNKELAFPYYRVEQA